MTDRITRLPNAITLPAEMADIVRTAAYPPRPGELIKSQINRAAQVLGLTPRRAETLWYGRGTHILAEEADRLRAWRKRWVEQRRDRLRQQIAALDRAEQQLQFDLILEAQAGGP